MKLPELLPKQKKEISRLLPQQNAISPTFVKRMIIGIILLIILVQIGFHRTYISHFPKFEDYTAKDGGTRHFTAIMHIHGMMMMGWLLMLLVQPILILKGNVKLHRFVGRLSYMLAPLVLLSMYLVTQSANQRALAQNDLSASARRMALDVPLIIFFAVLYILAIAYKHRTVLHSRYIGSTAFLLISPALARALRSYFELSRDGSIDVSRNIILFIALVVTIVDSLRLKRISPFALIVGFLVLGKIIWKMRETPFWQAIGSAIAKLF